MQDLKRLAIVNRGEAAMRALRAVAEYDRETGAKIRTIALYTDPDAASWFVRDADEAYRLGPATVADADGKRTHTYLDRARLRDALAAVRADAVWVGWGFVAEDAAFAEQCEAAGITFVGPPSDVIRRLGDKVAAKELAEKANVPVVPWSGGPVETAAEAAVAAADIGFPLLIKAAAGGGGRGIRRVERAEDLEAALTSARAEAELVFGDPTVFVEQLVGDAHHAEVQVMGDVHGTVWAVGVRDCSLQRRNQKILEESASVSVPEVLREQMKDAAVRLCQAAGYRNAGTVEYLYDPAAQTFFFMEVNTRLQVEHPVTELTTGLDLVKLQLHVARGGRLEGAPPPEAGHAIEVRLNAEDPERSFAPTPGRVEFLRMPAGPGIRVDTGVAQGDMIAPEFDSMVAKLLAWGRNRPEALARLRRALRETVVIVAGGTTNKAFLLTLLDRPEVIESRVTTGWLDRLYRTGEHVGGHHGSCLVAAAVEAYEVDHEMERARFLQSAARGRPELDEGPGRRVELRFRGHTYPLTVHRLGTGRYRLDTGEGLVDAEMEHRSSYERRLRVDGDRLKIVADVQGPTYQIEVEGVPHRIERDDGGLVRSPAPAVIISFAVGEGDDVGTGDPVAIIESMKMETTVYAPFAGRVRRLLFPPNAQVEAGAPLLQLEPTAQDRDETGPERLHFTRPQPAQADSRGPQERYAELLGALRSYLLGYDLDRETVQRLATDLPDLAADFPGGDDGVLALEREVLDLYADLGQLSRRHPTPEDEDDAAASSPREYLLTYLHSVDRAQELLPAPFVDRLRRALARYGVPSLDRTPDLEDALVWMYRAFIRLPRLTPAVAAILDGWLARWLERSQPAVEGVRDLLDRVIDAAEGRAPTVGDLAREVRFRLIDEPLLERARQDVYAEMDAALVALQQDPGRPDRGEILQRLVDCPQPLRSLLLRHALSDAVQMRETALEVRIRRFYRIRDIRDVRFEHHDGQTLGLADYAYEGRDIRLIMAYARFSELGQVLSAVATHLADVAPDRPVILDLSLQRSGTLVPHDVAEADVRRAVEAVPLGRDLHRLDTTVTFSGAGPEHRRTYHFTYRQRDGRLEEELLYRNLHPILAKRIGMWRLRNFVIERLPSAEDVYLFLGTAKDNPADRRLFAIAEVRDLTPAVDREGRITALPHLERMVVEAFSAMRAHLSRQPVDQRPVRNRLTLDVSPVITVPPDVWRELAHRLAPASVGLGLEKVVVRGRVPDGGGGLEDAVLNVENLGGRGVVVRRDVPHDQPITTLDAYRQKVLRTEQRGGVYPYELVRRLTPSEGAAADFPPGFFVEHDLDEDGRLRPVDRPYGQNTANLVVGIITNATEKVPEGMRRVIILGDPSRSLGSLAEPECRRVMGALDLADELGVPVEWFAVSSGARIAMDSGTENMDWIAAVLRRLIEFTQAGGEVNVVVTGINVGAQPYWNAEATMLMHTRGILVMTPASAMVLTGKDALDFSGGVSAEDNFGIGGFDRIMGPNGQGQYWAPTLGAACELLFRHYDHTYVVPGEHHPRRATTSDPVDRDVRTSPHAAVPGSDFTSVGDVFSAERNPERKKPFDMRSVMRAVTDADHEPLERWRRWVDAETMIVWDAHVGGIPVCLLGLESHTVLRQGFAPAGGPSAWTAGTLFPQSSRKAARAINAASGNRPVVVLANLSGFDGSPESMRQWQLEYGAEMGRAITNFRGPIVFCVVSRYHGGAFVVFSKPLNPQLEIAAVEGSYASVIGGTPAAAVVFARDVRKRAEADPRIGGLREQLAKAAEGHAGALRAELARVWPEVHAEKIGEVADEFDRIHSIERAQRVGSVDRIIAPGDLRPYIVEALERGLASP